MSFNHRRHRRWIALIALLGLLFQQFAMAAYACPLERGGANTSEAVSQLPPCHAAHAQDKARCHAHCYPQVQSPDHASPLTVPAMLPATTWLRVPDAPAPRHHLAERAFAARATAPPLTIQHCTFQI